jgi:hypothetical protein
MRNLLFALSFLAMTLVMYSCANSGNNADKRGKDTSEKIKQKDDGTIDLHIEKASCFNDNTNPSGNTAEWTFIVSKPGRYKVWLSSATIDTMDLQYRSKVKISFQDEWLDVKPVRDKIVLNASDVKYPYYRADSYMGTFYIQEPGEYSIQVISDKVIAQSDNNHRTSEPDHTKLISLFLTPSTN